MALNVKQVLRWREYNNIPVAIIAEIIGVSEIMVRKQLSGERQFSDQQELKLWAHMQRYKYTGAESCPAEVA